MKTWTDFEIVRRQVAIAGRVVDENNKPVAGAKVTITSMSDEFKRKVEGAAGTAGAGWEDMEERLDRAVARSDGLYYFLDLQMGEYTLSVSVPQSGKPNERTVSVSIDKKKSVTLKEESVKIGQADF